MHDPEMTEPDRIGRQRSGIELTDTDLPGIGLPEPRSVPARAPATCSAIAFIEDPDDERLADYRALRDPARRQRYDSRRGIVTVEGRVAVRQLLRSPFPVVSLLVDDHQVNALGDLVDAFSQRGAPVYVAAREVLAATAGFALHRGVVATARRLAPRDPGALVEAAAAARGADARQRVIAVLEGLNDHENLGALFRNAAAFGVAGVILDSACADPLYRRSVRVSAGHVLTTPFARLDRSPQDSWSGFFRRLHRAGFTVVALAPRHDERPIADEPLLPDASSSSRPDAGSASLLDAGSSALDDGYPFDEGHSLLGERPALVARELATLLDDGILDPGARTGVALLLGSEGSGLSASALALADHVVAIPMAPGVDSLNVATAAAIVFHELRR